MINKELVKEFISDTTCKECGSIQPYIWQHLLRLCKRCQRKMNKFVDFLYIPDEE